MPENPDAKATIALDVHLLMSGPRARKLLSALLSYGGSTFTTKRGRFGVVMPKEKLEQLSEIYHFVLRPGDDGLQEVCRATERVAA